MYEAASKSNRRRRPCARRARRVGGGQVWEAVPDPWEVGDQTGPLGR